MRVLETAAITLDDELLLLIIIIVTGDFAFASPVCRRSDRSDERKLRLDVR